MVQNGLNPNDRDNAALNKELESMQENDRECLKMFFQIVKFLAGQGIAFRGKTDNESNFRGALSLIVESYKNE